MTTPNLSMIRAAADLVGRDHSALEAAGAEKLAEGATCLVEVIAMLRGAWRAMSSLVAVESTTSSAGTTTVPADWRGLVLTGDGPKQLGDTRFGVNVERAIGAKVERGRYSGTRLFLRGYDGKLIQHIYDGHWSTVPREVSSWKATEREVNAVDAVELYGLVPILTSLDTALHAQAEGKTRDRAAQLRGDAEVIRSVTNLLRARGIR